MALLGQLTRFACQGLRGRVIGSCCGDQGAFADRHHSRVGRAESFGFGRSGGEDRISSVVLSEQHVADTEGDQCGRTELTGAREAGEGGLRVGDHLVDAVLAHGRTHRGDPGLQ